MKAMHALVLTSTFSFALSLPAMAQSYSASTWNPGTHPNAAIGYTEWAKGVEEATKGSLKFKVFTDGMLLPPRTTMQGVRDGVTQVGFVYPPYTPAEQPRASLLIDLMFVSGDSLIAELAFSEMNFTNASLQAEWKANGGVFGGGYTTPVYNFICAKPIETLEKFKGAKLRTASVSQTGWATFLGAVPVSVPFPDVYSGLQRGSIDCTIAGPENLGQGYKLAEVAKNVTTLPMGVVAGAMWVYNPKFWAGLKPEERRAMLDTSARMSVKALAGMQALAISGIESAKALKVPVMAPNAALNAKLEQFKKSFIAQLSEKAKAGGINNAEELVNGYLASEKKWERLLSTTNRGNEADVVALVMKELYGKLSERTYGLQ